MSLGLDVSWGRSVAQYVTGVNDVHAAATFGRRYVFADPDQTTVAIQARLNATFSPRLSLELYAQPYLSSGDYGPLKELAAPRTLDFLRYGQDIGTIAAGGGGAFTIDPDGAARSLVPGAGPGLQLPEPDRQRGAAVGIPPGERALRGLAAESVKGRDRSRPGLREGGKLRPEARRGKALRSEPGQRAHGKVQLLAEPLSCHGESLRRKPRMERPRGCSGPRSRKG